MNPYVDVFSKFTDELAAETRQWQLSRRQKSDGGLTSYKVSVPVRTQPVNSDRHPGSIRSPSSKSILNWNRAPRGCTAISVFYTSQLQ